MFDYLIMAACLWTGISFIAGGLLIAHQAFMLTAISKRFVFTEHILAAICIGIGLKIALIPF